MTKLYKGIYCCQKMYEEASLQCRHHPEGCPDKLVDYPCINGTDERRIEASINSGDRKVGIRFCPWCGMDLEELAGPVIGFFLGRGS